MNQYEVESRRAIYPPGGVQENPNSHPNPSRRQNFVRVNPRQDQQGQIQTKSCNNGCKWNCSTLLTLCVAFVHILVSTSIASVSSDMTIILFAIAAITINVFLCYGAICSRKESLITWLAFYGILLFIAMSCITPKHLKAKEDLTAVKNIATDQHHKLTETSGIIAVMFLTAVMIGCMVIVCNLLSQLEDVEEKKSNVTQQSLETPGQQQPQAHGSTGERNQMAPRPPVIRQSWIESSDQTRTRDARQITFQQHPGISLQRGVQNVSSTRQWQYGRYIGETQYLDIGDTESEQEVATISAAITAREVSDIQHQVIAAQSIYPDSSLPSYNQVMSENSYETALTSFENGQGEQREEDARTTGNNNNDGKPPNVVVYGENKYGMSDSNDQPPPTYELALKMMTKECSLGALPNETVFWTETETINNQQLPNNNTVIS